MGQLGVHFALSQKEERALKKAYGDDDDDAVMELVEAIEERWDEPHVLETDKAWDALHRCFTDGTLDLMSPMPPLDLAILGGESMYGGDDYTVVFLSKREVRDVAKALAPLDEKWLRGRYFTVVPKDYAAEYGEEDFRYTLQSLEPLKAFFARAAESKRSVIFTVGH